MFVLALMLIGLLLLVARAFQKVLADFERDAWTEWLSGREYSVRIETFSQEGGLAPAKLECHSTSGVTRFPTLNVFCKTAHFRCTFSS